MGNTIKDKEMSFLIYITDELVEKIQTYKEKKEEKQYKWINDRDVTYKIFSNPGRTYTSKHYGTKYEYDDKGDKYVGSSLTVLGMEFFFQCLRCLNKFSIKGCPNCDNDHLYFDREIGKSFMRCNKCLEKLFNWNCPKCGTRNPLSNTIFFLKKKDFCFIATAIYGSYSAPEVMALREFRDKVLRKNFLGKVFMKIYYLVSPPIANFIAQKEALKKIVKLILIDPIVKWLRRY